MAPGKLHRERFRERPDVLLQGATHNRGVHMQSLRAGRLDDGRHLQRVERIAHDAAAFELGPDFPPVWSPDSRWLAVVGTPLSGGSPQIHLVSAAGGESPLLPTAELDRSTDPAWSPDGGQLAFVSIGTSPNPSVAPAVWLYVVELETGALWPLTPGQRVSPPTPLITWSPDGRRLFYTAEGEPCFQGCPPGLLLMVPADASAPPVQMTDFPVDTFLGWR